jgi:hypothetical protein
MASPDDVGAFEKLIDEGTGEPEEIVAVIGETEGNAAPTISLAAMLGSRQDWRHGVR